MPEDRPFFLPGHIRSFGVACCRIFFHSELAYEAGMPEYRRPLRHVAAAVPSSTTMVAQMRYHGRRTRNRFASLASSDPVLCARRAARQRCCWVPRRSAAARRRTRCSPPLATAALAAHGGTGWSPKVRCASALTARGWPRLARRRRCAAARRRRAACCASSRASTGAANTGRDGAVGRRLLLISLVISWPLPGAAVGH